MKTTTALLTVFVSFFLGGLDAARATTIVVARTANEIVIGADSKVTDSYGNSLNNQACKIQRAGNLFLAFEGLLRDKRTGFSVAEISARALQLKPDASAAEKVSILTGFLTSALFDELVAVRRNSPREFQTKLEGQTFLRVVIAGFEKNKPLIFVRQFRMALIADKLAVTVFRDDCLEDCEEEVATRFVGETAAIDGLAEETPGFWNEGLAAGVRRLIELQIVARSEYVGPPIDIVQITPRGARWVQKKPACPDLQAPKRPVTASPRRRRR